MKYLKLICSFCLITTSLFSQATPSFFVSEPYFSKQNKFENVIRIEDGYTFGQFVGFRRNYGELGIFFAPASRQKWQPFIDLRGFLTDNGKWATNAGIGVRMWNPQNRRVLGGNLYYDYQDACVASFQRIGIGVESLGDTWDFRLNGYILVNGELQKGKLHTFHHLAGFVETCQVKERAFSGADAEIGAYLFHNSRFFLYGALGPYYYRTSCTEFVGGQARLQFNWMDNISLEGRLSQDKEFHTQVQGRIVVTIPLLTLFTFRFPPQNQTLIYQPVYRTPVITTQQCCHYWQNW